mmetsp:Transcript_78163/g.203084  ORF Transcript_78163/g.203084 Transcript_78163/m.203084 type:complete len:264 (+) Transcript_78163:78-869(+)
MPAALHHSTSLLRRSRFGPAGDRDLTAAAVVAAAAELRTSRLEAFAGIAPRVPSRGGLTAGVPGPCGTIASVSAHRSPGGGCNGAGFALSSQRRRATSQSAPSVGKAARSASGLSTSMVGGAPLLSRGSSGGSNGVRATASRQQGAALALSRWVSHACGSGSSAVPGSLRRPATAPESGSAAAPGAVASATAVKSSGIASARSSQKAPKEKVSIDKTTEVPLELYQSLVEAGQRARARGQHAKARNGPRESGRSRYTLVRTDC